MNLQRENPSADGVQISKLVARYECPRSAYEMRQHFVVFMYQAILNSLLSTYTPSLTKSTRLFVLLILLSVLLGLNWTEDMFISFHFLLREDGQECM